MVIFGPAPMEGVELVSTFPSVAQQRIKPGGDVCGTPAPLPWQSRAPAPSQPLPGGRESRAWGLLPGRFGEGVSPLAGSRGCVSRGRAGSPSPMACPSVGCSHLRWAPWPCRPFIHLLLLLSPVPSQGLMLGAGGCWGERALTSGPVDTLWPPRGSRLR